MAFSMNSVIWIDGPSNETDEPELLDFASDKLKNEFYHFCYWHDEKCFSFTYEIPVGSTIK